MRVHVPERALTTWIVLDVSPSMAFGTARRLKADVAEGAALVFGRLAVRRAGSVALVAFGAGEPRVLPPRGSKPGMVALRRTLAEGVAPDGENDAGALAAAMRCVSRLARQPGLVVVISDFRDQHAWERPLGSLRMRHSVLAIEVSDPRERELPAVGMLAADRPRDGARIEVDTSRRRVRERFAALERERRERVASELRRLRVDQVTLSTGEDWLQSLGAPPAMSFAAPVWLAALVLLPLAIARIVPRTPARAALRRPLPGGRDARRSPASARARGGATCRALRARGARRARRRARAAPRQRPRPGRTGRR